MVGGRPPISRMVNDHKSGNVDLGSGPIPECQRGDADPLSPLHHRLSARPSYDIEKPIATLRVQVISGRDLLGKDNHGASSDP